MFPAVARSFTAVVARGMGATAQAGAAAPALLQASGHAATGHCSCKGPCRCQSLPMVFSRLLHAHPNPPKDPSEALEYLRQGNKVRMDGWVGVR